MNKIRVIERSLRCYTLGWFAFLPLAGVVFGPMTVLLYQSIRMEVGKAWNPASRYLHCGALLGCLGLLFSLLLWGLLFVVLMKHYES